MTTTLASAFEALMCQVVAQEKHVIIEFSVTTAEKDQPKDVSRSAWKGIDPIFMKDVINNQ